jgi:3-oxoadipate enol-lactonase
VRVRANGIEIDCRIDGGKPGLAAPDAGPPWLTLVTGIANDAGMWDDHMEDLARTHRVLRYDLRGLGGSQSTPAPYTLDLLIADLVGLWDVLDIGRSALGGLGLGGCVSIGTALAHPGRVSALVPISCRAALVPEYQAIWPPLIEAVRARGIEAIVEPTLERWFSPDFRAANPATMNRVRATIRRASVDGYLGCIAALLGLDYGPRLSRLALPVLFVSGEYDRVGAPPYVMQAMADKVTGARHVVLPRATHISPVCNPKAFVQALADFLPKD